MANLMRTPPACDSKNTPQANKRLRTDPPREHTVPPSSDDDVNQTTLNRMFDMMMVQFTETKHLIDTVRDELSDINGKIDAVKTELQGDIKSFKDECAAKFQHHDTALDSLKLRINSVTQNIGTLENRNELVISGIPFQNDENLGTIFNSICKHLAILVPNTPIGKRRMRTSNENDKNGLIVLEFALKTTRDEFYRAYLRKRDLKLRHIGLDSDRRAYINESLTLQSRKVKMAALRLKKDGKLVSVYTKLGVVVVKHTVNGPPIEIRSEEELNVFV